MYKLMWCRIKMDPPPKWKPNTKIKYPNQQPPNHQYYDTTATFKSSPHYCSQTHRCHTTTTFNIPDFNFATYAWE